MITRHLKSSGAYPLSQPIPLVLAAPPDEHQRCNH